MNTIKGLNNIGNTCYLNSGLQMIIQNVDFCKLIIQNKDKSPNLKIMADFITEYYTSESSSVTPDQIKKMVGEKNKIFRGNSQQDSAEFIVYLVDILDTELKGELNKIFNITTENTVKCKIRKCLTKSITNSKSPFLIIPIKDEDNTLDDCYRSFKIHEKLEGDEMYYCENCKAKRIASRRVNVIDWSDNLIIWLKRFENHKGRLSKNNKEIEIPIDWRHDFTIKGAVIHHGGINGGHYVYMSRNVQTNTWYMCDDSSVRQIPSEHVQPLLNRAYIFNYIKK